LNGWVVRDHLSRDVQGDLEKRGCGHIGGCQLIGKAIPVRIYSQAEAFFRLDAMVMVKSVVRELTDGYNISRLMEWPDQ
jgi:hypothetical protein